MARRKIDAMHEAYGTSPHLCKDCNHFMRREHGNTYFKCKAYGISKAESTDWRANWMACGLFGKPIRDYVKMIDRLKHAGKQAPVVVLEGQISFFDAEVE